MTRYPDTTLPQVDLPPQVRWRTDRLLELADVIENKSTGLAFDMIYWPVGKIECGTPCCIGGHADFLYRRSEDVRCKWEPTAAALGMDAAEGTALFFPSLPAGSFTYDEITPAMAAAVLRHAAKEFVIDWGVAL